MSMITLLYSALVSPLLAIPGSWCNVLARGQWSRGESLEGLGLNAPSQTSAGPSAGSYPVGWRRADVKRAEPPYPNMQLCGGYVLGAFGDQMQAWEQKADTEADGVSFKEKHGRTQHWPMVAWVAWRGHQ